MTAIILCSQEGKIFFLGKNGRVTYDRFAFLAVRWFQPRQTHSHFGDQERRHDNAKLIDVDIGKREQ